jgi:hydrogenase maturation protease
MTGVEGSITVVGIGNVLLRDDGVGVHVVRELERLVDRGEVRLARGTRLVDGGTLGMDLLPIVAGSRALVLVDALCGGQPPGTVGVIRDDALHGGQAVAGRIIDPGVGDLVGAAALLGTLPDAVVLVGIEPGEIAVGLELSPVVRAALPAAVAAVVEELGRLGGSAESPMIDLDLREREMAGATA